MDRIGEIDRRRAAWQGDEAPLRREAEHLVLEQFELGVFEEFLRAVALGQEFDGPPQPLIGAAFRGEARMDAADLVLSAGFLVMGMRGDAVFGDLVHGRGADLQLDALALRPDHGGVDRAVIVLFRGGDVVLVATRHHRPGGVHDTQRPVTLGQGFHDDAESEDVRELLEGDGFTLHLGGNGKGPLFAAR